MLKLYITIYYEFMKIGLLAIGGGYAALPFLYYIQEKYNWFSTEELTNMIAISNITPGPIGINMATYTGFTIAGILGSILATSAIITIPFVFVVILMKVIKKYNECNAINDVFKGLRVASCSLLTYIGMKLLIKTISPLNSVINNFSEIDIKAIILFLVILIPFTFFKKNPLLVILAGGIGGILIKMI